MTLTRTDVIQIRAAKAAARAAGMFVVEKPGKFLLYRECKPRNVPVGTCATPAELQRLVADAATVTPAAGQRP